jgi:hypothetical protein
MLTIKRSEKKHHQRDAWRAMPFSESESKKEGLDGIKKHLLIKSQRERVPMSIKELQED